MKKSPPRSVVKPIFGFISSRRARALRDVAKRGPQWVRALVGASIFALGCHPGPASANNPGGGTGTGANVTLVDNGDGTVTVANGIVAINIGKANARLNSINYTYNNNGTTRTTEVLEAAGQYYWGGFITFPSGAKAVNFSDGPLTYSASVDPSGNRVDVELLRGDTAQDGTFETHFTMLRGSTGFYTTGVITHGAGDIAENINAFGLIMRVTPSFNWLSADPLRNFFTGAQSTTPGVRANDIPKESGISTSGGLAGEYGNKFSTALDHGDQRAWGFSSVGPTGTNIGLWQMGHPEYYGGGPLKHDDGVYGNIIANQILTQELGQGTDSAVGDNEVWSKTCGPWFVYVNNVSSSITDPAQAAQALFNDAVAQDAAEKGAWPYSWFSNPAYAPASGRSNVTGKLAISDPGNRNPAVAGTWVGLIQQPSSFSSPMLFDFQKWLKPYQFWAQTDSGGNFTIPDVIAGSNYTLWAYGPGVAGTFMSQPQAGGTPPFETTGPATPLSISVPSGGGTYALPATVTWTPKRDGATVFEIGVPDRKADEFRHGEDYWQGELPPQVGFPTPVWGAQAYYLQEFPNGITYNVGASRWDTDWNYVLPSQIDSTGSYLPTKATINFNLPAAPSGSAKTALYAAIAGDNGGEVVFSVNGQDLDTASGVTVSPAGSLLSTGFSPPPYGNYMDNSSIHMGVHGPFEDVRINFPSTLLHQGANTITIAMNKVGYSYNVMLDYLRLELQGFVPPAPTSVTVYPGNNRNLVTWPVMPGAARYNILRSTTSGSGYVSLWSGDLGPVSGSDSSVATFNDTSAANNTIYYYVVQSWNVQNGFSANSPQGAGKPLSTLPTSAPATPTLSVSGSVSHQVNLSWGATPGANYYVITRRTLAENNASSTYVLRTIVLNDYVTGTTYTDATVSNGKIYDYSVKAVNAVGSSGDSALAMAVPQPPSPSAAGGVSATALSSTSVKLTWTAADNATGYVIYRSTTSGSFGSFPANYANAGVETFLTDKGLVSGTTYYYRVTAVNSGGISPHAYVTVTTP